MMHLKKSRKALTLEESVLIATGLNYYKTLNKALKGITYSENGELKFTNDLLFDTYFNAKEILKELIEDAKLCHKNNTSDAKTVLQVVNPEGTTDQLIKGIYPDVEISTFTTQATAQWLHEAGLKDEAKTLVPNFTPNPDSVIELKEQNKKLLADNATLEKQLSEIALDSNNSLNNYPSGIKNTVIVYDEFWKHLTNEIIKPKKEDLIEFITTKLGITEKTSIEALIKLSTPDNKRLGGTPKKEQVIKLKPKK